VTSPPHGTTYVPERQSEYWASRKIEDFFWDLGYECLSFPISPRIEKLIPADFIFVPSHTIKIFGLQYKALYRGAVDYWDLDAMQHQQMKSLPWIYYALSEMRTARDFRAALHALRFPDPAPSPGKVYINSFAGRGYLRWWAFYERLRDCHLGHRVHDEADFINAFVPVWDSPIVTRELDNMADVFLFNTTARRLVRFSTMLSPLIQ